MGTIANILNRYDFKQLRVGGTHDALQIAGPSLVIVTCEREADNQGHIAQELLDAAEALTNLSVTRLLTQNWGHLCNGQVVVWIAHVPDDGQRKSAVLDLRALLANRPQR